MTTYSAVVETGSHSAYCSRRGCPRPRVPRYEERMHCGHAHRTIEAAEACGAKHYNSRYVRGSWTANAAWHGYTIHDQDGHRAR